MGSQSFQINIKPIQREKDDCIPNPCQNGGTCTDGVDFYSYSCIKKAGYSELWNHKTLNIWFNAWSLISNIKWSWFHSVKRDSESYQNHFKQISMTAPQTRVRIEEPALMELVPTSVLVKRNTVKKTVKKDISSLNNRLV